MRIRKTLRYFSAALISLILSAAAVSCSADESVSYNRYSCGADQETIVTSYYVHDPKNNAYEIYLSSVPESEVPVIPNSFIFIYIPEELMNHSELDLSMMPNDITEYEFRITIRHNSIQASYYATKTPNNSDPRIECDGIINGLLSISKSGEDYFDITMNLTDSEGNKVLCIFNDILMQRTKITTYRDII